MASDESSESLARSYERALGAWRRSWTDRADGPRSARAAGEAQAALAARLRSAGEVRGSGGRVYRLDGRGRVEAVFIPPPEPGAGPTP